MTNDSEPHSQAGSSRTATRLRPKDTTLLGRLRLYFDEVQMHLGTRFLVLGVVVGLLGGVTAIALRLGILWIADLFYGDSLEVNTWRWTFDPSMWKLVAFPVLAGAVVGGLTELSKMTRGHGIPEVMNAVATRRGVIPFRIIRIKLLASLLSIGSGFSVGRVGPTVLIGSAIGSCIGQVLKLSVMRMRMLIGCGAAAGVAATFNSPIAGTLFALEIIVGDFNIAYLTPILMAAMAGTVVSRSILGDFHDLLPVSEFQITGVFEYGNYIILGLVIGYAGVAFTRLHVKMDTWARRLELPGWLMGGIGGCGIAILLILFPMASGPANWNALHFEMQTELTWSIALLLVVLAIVKMVATSWSIAMGASGGIFAPALLIGGALGASFGFVLNKVVPALVSTPLGYSLIGMGAFFAAIVGAPLTAITIVFELTNDYNTILPLIIACITAMTVYSHYISGNIYTLKLLARGIDLQGGHEVGIMKGLAVRGIYRNENVSFLESTPIPEVIAFFAKSTRSTVPVVDRDHTLLGVIGVWDLKTHAKDEGFPDKLTVADIETKNVRFVTPDDSLYDAMDMISDGDYEYLPVVSDAETRRLLGRISRQLVLQAYKNSLTMKGMARVMAGKVPLRSD